MAMSMYTPGVLSTATRNFTYHIYARVYKLVRLHEPVLDLLCSLFYANYSEYILKNHLYLIHLDSLTLFSRDEFTEMVMVCLKSDDRNINIAKYDIVSHLGVPKRILHVSNASSQGPYSPHRNDTLQLPQSGNVPVRYHFPQSGMPRQGIRCQSWIVIQHYHCSHPSIHCV